MKRTEFDKYYSIVASSESGKLINSEDLGGISEMRNRVSVLIARLGQELARIKNAIDSEYVALIEMEGVSKTAASVMAEEKVNRNNEVSRREVQYLLEAMYNFSNSCASRLNVLKGEKI